MRLKDFSYNIPDELIASQPPKIRGASQLLVLDRRTGSISDRKYSDIIDYLKPGDVLVINNTKVIKARLITHKSSGGERELVLVEKHGKDDNWYRHRVLYRRKLKDGDELFIASHKLLVEEIVGDGIAIIKSEHDLLEIADQHGSVPLPPYMKRPSDDNDVERYQTVFAKEIGSVAAPTASLNMTQEILNKLRARGVIITYATLHVGLGTFLPIRVDDIAKHKMHQEFFEVPAETMRQIQKAKSSHKRIIALGTTVTRTLEYCHEDILNEIPTNLEGEADIFIYPGYEFKVIDGLITNFHAPESTVLMLTAAFADWGNLKPAYEHAVDKKYRFFSYGDSMLII